MPENIEQPKPVETTAPVPAPVAKKKVPAGNGNPVQAQPNQKPQWVPKNKPVVEDLSQAQEPKPEVKKPEPVQQPAPVIAKPDEQPVAPQVEKKVTPQLEKVLPQPVKPLQPKAPEQKRPEQPERSPQKAPKTPESNPQRSHHSGRGLDWTQASYRTREYQTKRR